MRLKLWHKLLAVAFAAPFIIFGGSKQPPVVTTDGINLKSVHVTSKYVDFSWEVKDEKCSGKPLRIESWNAESRTWDVRATVDAGETSYRYNRYTIDKTYRWRISCDVTEE